MSELKPCPFCECPPGMFLFSGALFFKSEYGSDAYCISSGEMFWGGADDASDRAKLVVYPIEYEALEDAWNCRAQPDNEPLTIEELRGMDGEPVWVDLIFGKIRNESPLHKEDTAGWYIISCSKMLSVSCEPYALKVNADNFYTNKNYMMQEGCVYGETWLAHRRKPEPEGERNE